MNTILKGLNKETIKKISSLKNEPQWMLEFRLSAYQTFLKLKNPQWGPNLNDIDFNDFIYYSNHNLQEQKKWEDVPQNIRTQFEAIGVSELESKILSGANDQFDSQVVYHDLIEEFAKKGVLFCSMDEAITKYETIVKKYFGKLIPDSDNKYAALNSAVWSGGSFLYVPKGVVLEKPLQAYFKIGSKSLGQFERTLIVIEDNSEAHYMEGCTAPIYSEKNLHAAVVEIFIGNNSHFRYSTIQNWSNNVINLVTKRALVGKHSLMEWIDGNIGSGINMKYPTCILKGDYAKGRCVSIATSGKNMIQDTGAKMIHLGKHTKSEIISKTIVNEGGEANYRGLVKITKSATDAYAQVTCDSLILDNFSRSDTIPTEIIENNTSFIKHEAKVTDIDKEKKFFLNSRGVDDKQARLLSTLGFIKPFSDELPLEYSVEFNRLLKVLIK